MLSKIWEQQKNYNEKIFKIEGEQDKEYWSRQYLLGLTSQVAEVLREIRWKRNRNESDKVPIKQNVVEEIADIMKFTLCLAQAWNISEQELLEAVYEKGEILDFKLQMEFKEPLVKRKILITDIDGTLADYRKSFQRFLSQRGIAPAPESTTILFDSTLDIKYAEYHALKHEFEELGGYRYLIPYPDTFDSLKAMRELGFYIIAVTSRPADIYKRIFKDTLHWFKANEFPIDELHMVDEGRLLLAHDLVWKNEVVLWEDNPDLLVRANNTGIFSVARRQTYNSHLKLQNVIFVDNYMEWL